jgi:hypothetical protein
VDVEEDPKILGIRNWKRYAMEREGCRSNIQDAKVRKGEEEEEEE